MKEDMESFERIIADTSVWIEFFKNNGRLASTMTRLLEKNCICGVGCIFGELLGHARSVKEGKIILEYWDCLFKLDESNIWVEAGLYLNKNREVDNSLCLIDGVIIVLAVKNNVKVWSMDKKLKRALPQNLSYNVS